MPPLKFSMGYVDLRPPEAELFANISCRTEIRRAQKDGVIIKNFGTDKSADLIKECRRLLAELLWSELVPYSQGFDQLIQDPQNDLMTAWLEDKLISFIVVAPNRNSFFGDTPTVSLALSATDPAARQHCPNYLLLWEAIRFFKSHRIVNFNLGLLTYENCPDPDLERVAFFKRKWNIRLAEFKVEVSWLNYLYHRYFKRFRIFKMVLYLARPRVP